MHTHIVPLQESQHAQVAVSRAVHTLVLASRLTCTSRNMLISCIEQVGTIGYLSLAQRNNIGRGPWAHSTSSSMCKKHISYMHTLVRAALVVRLIYLSGPSLNYNTFIFCKYVPFTNAQYNVRAVHS